MIEQLITEILEQDSVRGQLSALRKECKEFAEQKSLCYRPEVLERMEQLLSHEDGKTRKNVALLLGDLADGMSEIQRDQEVLDWLWQAYRKEDTKYVLSAYIRAMSFYDCTRYMEALQAEFEQLTKTSAQAEDVKHIRELRMEMEKILLSKTPQKETPFLGIKKKHSILLVAEPYIQDAVMRQLECMRMTQAKAVARGVKVKEDSLDFLAKIRLYREVLFAIRLKMGIVLDREHLAEGIASSECLSLLKEVFGTEGPFPFKLSYKGRTEEFPHKEWKRICFEIEEYTNHQLCNVVSNYLIEIQVYPKKDGTFYLYGRFPSMADKRFSYRKNALPTSMSPVTAAQMVELITPYLKENAHVIDPFCGIGTLLIERCKKMPARDVYGVDIYGEAIMMARDDTDAANMEFYYINRDYFDFTSEYLMEEVITEFPRMEHKRKDEVDLFYEKFFVKTSSITSPDAILLLLSTEEINMKKQIRIHKEFQLLRQIPMRGKENIFIIKKRG